MFVSSNAILWENSWMPTKVFFVCLSIVAVLVAILVATILFLGQAGTIVVGLGMGVLTFLLGIILRLSGRRDQAIERLFEIEGEPAAISSAKQGAVSWFRGRLISGDDHDAPYSQQQVAYWLAKATRISHRPRAEFELEHTQQPHTIEIDDGSGSATITMRDVSVCTQHTYGPTSWYWRDSDEDRRLERVVGDLHPDTEIYKGRSGHYSLSEKLLRSSDEVTVVGEVSLVEQGERPRIEIKSPTDDQLIVSNYTDQQIYNLIGFRSTAAFWSIPFLIVAIGYVGIAINAMIRG